MSRMELSKRLQLSTYQVEGLEGESTQNLLNKVFSYVRALGFKTNQVFNLMELAWNNEQSNFSKGDIGHSISETVYGPETKLVTYIQEKNNFIGSLHLGVGKSVERTSIITGDMMFGIVREGTIVIDVMVKQTVHKKDHFFILPEALPAVFMNTDNYAPASILLFSVKYPS